MQGRPKSLSLENLESRLNLSSLGGLTLPQDLWRITAQEKAIANRYKVISLTDYLAATTTNGNQTAPSNAAINAPSNLLANPSSTAISLKWTDNSNNESTFRVYRSTDGLNFAQIGTTNRNKTTYVDKTAATGVTYYYAVAAYNANSQSPLSNLAMATRPVPVTAPLAPTDFTAAPVSQDSIALSWTDNATNETRYHIYRSTDGGLHYTAAGDVTADTTTFTDTGLNAGTTYTYTIAAWNSGGGESYVLTPATVTTLAPAPAPAALVAPAAPASVTISNLTSIGLTVNWTDTAADEDGFHVYRSTDGVTYTRVADLPANASSFADGGLDSGATYYYQIAAFNSAGETAAAPASATTLVVDPAAPLSLNFSNVTTNSLRLNWTDASNDESGFHVYRSTDGVTFSKIADVDADATSFTDAGLAGGTTYYYQVSSWNAAGETFSAAASRATQTAAPAAPSGLTLSNLTSSGITLNWADVATNESGYRVYRSTDGANFAKVADLAVNTTTFADAGLAAGTTYYYKVSAWNAGGETQTSALSGTTQAPIAVPTAPGSLSFSLVTSSSLTLNWSDTATTESGYRVYRSTDGVNFTKVSDLAAGATTFSDAGLASSTTYTYKVSAWNSSGESFGTPASALTAAPPATGGITISTRNMTSFNELFIDGTSGNDSIVVTQSNGVLTIVANGVTSTYANTFGDIMIRGAAGDDSLTVDSSVNIAALLYGGDGNNTLRNLTTGKATIVSIGNGVNVVTGNGINTGFWVNPGDTVNASAAEINLGGVNRVANWYQPFTTDSTNANYVPRSLNGQNLTDPTDSGPVTRLSNSSFWGTGARAADINQTGLADCYFLAPLASLANNEQTRFMNMATDLGDGTYAIRFIRNGVTSFVRVDGDLAAGGWNFGLANAAPGASGNQWGGLFEKAYAFYRSGSNSYSSLNWGYQSSTFSDLGLGVNNTSAGLNANAILNLVQTQIAANHGVTASTNSSINDGSPLIASHVYSIFGAYVDATSGSVMIQLRNPWGVDGAGSDGANDGLVTITYAQFTANFNTVTYSTV